MSYQYEVALSFAGENRKFAETVANGLRKESVNVFYDDHYVEDLWGEDLAAKLREVYHKNSQFCIMIISQHYVDKMWPNHERQQAIERMIKDKGKAYVLPVRLDGYSGEVPGLSGTIGYLSVKSNQPQRVVETFLRKIGREGSKPSENKLQFERPKKHVPRIKKSYTDRDKHQFLRLSFEEVVNLIDQFASDTKEEYEDIEYDIEKVTSRKVLFSLYKSGGLVTQAKIFIGGMMGSDSICINFGSNIDVSSDTSYHDIISLKEAESGLGFSSLGLSSFGQNQDKHMSPREVAEYLWKQICEHIT